MLDTVFKINVKNTDRDRQETQVRKRQLRGNSKHFHLWWHRQIACWWRWVMYIKMLRVIAFSRRGRVRSSRHSSGQPSWHTAAPRLRRCTLYVCGSTRHRAWGLVCTAPERFPNPSAHKRLLDIRPQNIEVTWFLFSLWGNWQETPLFWEVVWWNGKHFPQAIIPWP